MSICSLQALRYSKLRRIQDAYKTMLCLICEKICHTRFFNMFKVDMSTLLPLLKNMCIPVNILRHFEDFLANAISESVFHSGSTARYRLYSALEEWKM